MIEEIILFAFIGFVAQLIDGALGMAYGVSSTTFFAQYRLSASHCKCERSHGRDIYKWCIRAFASKVWEC